MKSTTKRTLVKSAPELWELADDRERMEAWLCDVAGGPAPEVEVTEREPGQRLAWQNTEAAIDMELAEGTFGTAVRISANHGAADPNGAKAALERLLDELGSPERRPFSRD